MNPKCILGLKRSYREFMACQTQVIITVIVIINNITFIINLLDEKILQEQASTTSSFPSHPVFYFNRLQGTKAQHFFQVGLSSLSLSPTLSFFHVHDHVNSHVGQCNLKLELPEKHQHCLSGYSEMISRPHANEPMALLTNQTHLGVALRKNLMETSAMNAERRVPLVVFHPFCFCYQF